MSQKLSHNVPLSDAIILIGAVVAVTLFAYTQDNPAYFLERRGGWLWMLGLALAGLSIRRLICSYGKNRNHKTGTMPEAIDAIMYNGAVVAVLLFAYIQDTPEHFPQWRGGWLWVVGWTVVGLICAGALIRWLIRFDRKNRNHKTGTMPKE